MRRREFFRRSLLLGAAGLAGSHLAPPLFAASPSAPAPATGLPDLGVAEGDDAFAATLKAVELVGGIGRFVPPGAKVGLLVNAPPWWKKPGSFTSPEVTLALLKLCVDAGAGAITYVINPAPDYWQRTPRSAAFAREIAAAKANPADWTEVEIPKGRSLKKARVNRVFLDCDVLINVPIAKHHAGTGYTGCLKNAMGACHRETNKFFHNGSGAKGEYEDVAFLSQCIADINLVRKPALNVCDATEFLLTGGPAGPGELRKARKVVAGADPVAVDAFACRFLNLKPDQVQMIQMAAAHGIGAMDLSRLTVRESGA